MSVIILTTGQPGAGKSYSRVRWLVTDFLVNSKALFITNLPLNVELICHDLSSKYNKDYDYYLNRIVIISDDELKRWREMALLDKNELKKIKDDDGFLPAEFFDKYDLSGAHIAIDEFHRYCSKSDPLMLRKVWNDWFAEIRKIGCTFEAITQDISQLPRDFYGKVGQKIDLSPFGNTLDPFFKIKMYDWYQLKGGYTGKINSVVEQIESIKDVSNSGAVSWREIKHDRFRIKDEFFLYYNSFQKSDNSDQKQDFTCPATIYKKKVIFWFLRRNFLKLFGKFVLVLIVIWLTFGGGLSKCVQAFTSSMTKIQDANTVNDSIQNKNTYNDYLNSTLSITNKQNNQYLQDTSLVLNVRDFQPVLFFNSIIILRNGTHVTQNYIFKSGFFKDKKITYIDQSLRQITIDSSYTFGMFDVLPLVEQTKPLSNAF